jgi:hypothetical protein
MYRELTYPPRAISKLGQYLHSGSITLFLGAGASTGVGLPKWIDLVNNLRETKGLSKVPDYSNADQLQLAVSEFRKKCTSDDEYNKIVKEVLYADVTNDTNKLLHSDLLMAIGALIMGSRRGSVKKVVTYNFDSVLEWYLQLNGYVSRVIQNLPTLEGSEDVTIYHPHGFLPINELNLSDSETIIFDFHSVNRRIGRVEDHWNNKIRQIMLSSVCLFVGLSINSFRDRAINPFLTNCSDNIKNGPLGFWLFKDDISEEDEDACLECKIVPIKFETNLQISDFILEICRNASSNMILT